MNLSKLIIPALMMVSASALAQGVETKKHRVVIQFSSGDSVSQRGVIVQVNNLRAGLPGVEVEVVCHSAGLDLLNQAKSKASKGVAELSALGVTFAACNNSMRARNVRKEDLLSQAQVVPSAIVELTLKQEEGWTYFKGGH